MKKKISKTAFFVIISAFAFLTLGIFLANGFSNGYALAVSGNGGLVYVSSSSTNTINSESTITGGSATNGGGVYVASGGTLRMTGGVVSGNTATSGSGNDIFNNGTFTMTGGTIGTSGSSQTGYGIYNTGTMNLYGGTVYDNIYSSVSFNTEVSANIEGTITLGNNATITVQDYDGTTPSYKIVLSSSRENGVVVTLKGSSTSPSLSKLTISGYNTQKSKLSISQSSGSSTSWEVKLVPQQYTLTLNKGTGVSSVSGAGTYDYGTVVQVSSSPSQGYSGGYWTGSQTINSQTGTVTMTGNMTLTAYANPNIYKITLDNQSATTAGTTEIYEKYATGYYSDSTGATSITSITVPTMKTQDFCGYWTEKNGSGDQIIDSTGKIVGSNTKFLSATTIYAKWTIKTFNVAFDANGGETNQTNITMTYGEYYSSSVSVPTRLGYRFYGYYLMRGASKIYYFNGSGVACKDCDFSDDEVSDGVVTLKADWSFIDKTFVRVNAKGIEDSNGNYVLYGVYPQTKVTKTIILSELNKNATADGYSYFNDDAYYKYNGNWFKIEPIMWEIVETHETDYITDNSTCYTLVSTKILDLSIFNNTNDSSLNSYPNVFWYHTGSGDGEWKSVLFDNVHNIVGEYGSWYLGNVGAVMNTGVGIYDYDDTYNMKINLNRTYGDFDTIYPYTLRVPSYTDLVTYSGTITRQKTATDFASAKGSGSTWWLAQGSYQSNSYAWFVNENGDWDESSITETRGIVPMVRINDYYLLDCGHVYDESTEKDGGVNYDNNNHWDEATFDCIKGCGGKKIIKLNITPHSTTTSTSYSYLDGDSNHTQITTTKCSHCDYKKTSTITMAHTGGTTVSITYSDNGDGTHTKRTTKKGCSVCGIIGEYVIEEKVKHTTTTSTTTAHDDSGHWTETTTTCSDNCGYKTVTKGSTVAHTTTSSSNCTWFDGESTHTVLTTTKCSGCSYSKTTSLSAKHIGGTTVSISYSDNGDGTHTKKTTMNGCSVCGVGQYVIEENVKHTTSSTSATAYDDTNHWTETTTTCSYCSYNSVSKSNIVAHTLKTVTYWDYNTTKHWECTYQLCEANCGYRTEETTGTKTKHTLVNGSCIVCDYGTLAFTSSQHSHTCESCNEVSIVNEESILVDDKRKNEVLLLDEKRYSLNGYEARNFQI